MSRPDSKRCIRRIKFKNIKNRTKKIVERECNFDINYNKVNRPEYLNNLQTRMQNNINIRTNTPCRCSKPWCCGNPRKLGEKTLQEIKSDISYKEFK